MVKKIGLILSVLLIAAGAFGCGGSSENQDAGLPVTEDSPTAPSAAGTSTGGASWGDDGGANTTTEAATSVDETTETETFTIDRESGLPNGYPSDIFPVYPGSHILDVMEMPNSYVVTAYSEAHHSDVIAFYKEVFQDAEVMSQSETEISLTSFGTKQGYTYTFDTGESTEYAGYKTQISLTFYK